MKIQRSYYGIYSMTLLVVIYSNVYMLILNFSFYHRLFLNLPAAEETWVLSPVGKILWRREWPPTPVFLPGESHGQRSPAGYSLGSQEWDTT